MSYNDIIAICWLILLGCWLVMAFDTKKSVRKGSWRTGAYVRLAVLIALVLILRFPEGRHLLRHARYTFLFPGPLVRAIGVAICALGVALAIWARVYLGRNWGMPRSLKENPELVTNGPYAVIRHPIYSGILAAVLGSALAESGLWLLPFVLFCAYFIYSATREEKNMTRQFPGAYPDYKKRTWMIIPFVL
jgi:protein-S-isoprenylcysteine O-methyltransferase Ste14